jgi:hypothetical protein
MFAILQSLINRSCHFDLALARGATNSFNYLLQRNIYWRCAFNSRAL